MTIRRAFPILLLVLLAACGENPQRHLDLGQWYYQKGLIDDAILEYREAIRLAPADVRRMSRPELELVAGAHKALSVAYAKKEWYEMALVEARKTFELLPTPEHYDLLELIRRRGQLEIQPSPSSVP